MTTVNLTADLQALAEKINDMPHPCPADAFHAAVSLDLQGLAFIANIAESKHGTATRRLTEMLDLADYLQGNRIKCVTGR